MSEKLFPEKHFHNILSAGLHDAAKRRRNTEVVRVLMEVSSEPYLFCLIEKEPGFHDSSSKELFRGLGPVVVLD